MGSENIVEQGIDPISGLSTEEHTITDSLVMAWNSFIVYQESNKIHPNAVKLNQSSDASDVLPGS